MKFFKRFFDRNFSNEDLFTIVSLGEPASEFERAITFIYDTRFWIVGVMKGKFSSLTEEEILSAYGDAVMDLIPSFRKQSTYEAWEAYLPQFWRMKDKDAISSFIYHATRKNAIDIHRKNKRVKEKDESVQEGLLELLPVADYDMTTFEEAEILEKAFGGLIERDRDMLMDYYFEGLNRAEMSEKYNISEGSVSQTVMRAKKKLMENIKNLRGSEDDSLPLASIV